MAKNSMGLKSLAELGEEYKARKWKHTPQTQAQPVYREKTYYWPLAETLVVEPNTYIAVEEPDKMEDRANDEYFLKFLEERVRRIGEIEKNCTSEISKIVHNHSLFKTLKGKVHGLLKQAYNERMNLIYATYFTKSLHKNRKNLTRSSENIVKTDFSQAMLYFYYGAAYAPLKKTAEKVFKSIFKNTYNHIELIDFVKKHKSLPFDKIPDQWAYNSFMLNILAYDIDEKEEVEEDEKEKNRGAGIKRSQETQIRQLLFEGASLGYYPKNDDLRVGFKSYQYDSSSFNRANKLEKGTRWYESTLSMTHPIKEAKNVEYYFPTIYELYQLIVQQPNLSEISITPIIDTSHPLQREFWDPKKFDTLLKNNTCKVWVMFWVKERGVTILANNAFWKATYIVPGNITKNPKFQKEVISQTLEIEERGMEIRENKKKGLFVSGVSGFWSWLREEFDAQQLRIYTDVEAKELVKWRRKKRLFEKISAITGETINTTMGRF